MISTKPRRNVPMTRMLVAAVTLALALAVSAGKSESASTTNASGACPVTRPNWTVPPGAGFVAAGFNYGNADLRAQIWPNGTLVAGILPDGGAMAIINPDGSIWAKLGWWRGVPGKLVIRGRRLDASAPPLRADVPNGYGSLGFQATGLIFPTVGCWRVVGRVGRARLTFVVKVTKLKNDWTALHRPLHLPRLAPGAMCPVSRVDSRVDWNRVNIFGGSGIGRGPVYPGLGAPPTALLEAVPDEQYGGPWGGQKVFWYVLSRYRGRVLIRGRRLDGPQRMRFNAGKLPRAELRIETHDTVSWSGQPTGSRGVPSEVRVLVSGCYGVQIDGTSFSRIVVFRVSLAR
jgi:hypothetical protein